MTVGRQRPDVIGPVTLNLVGIALIIAAWVGASAQAQFGPQIVYVNLGVAGAIVAGSGDALYLFQARRIVAARRAALGRHRRVTAS